MASTPINEGYNMDLPSIEKLQEAAERMGLELTDQQLVEYRGTVLTGIFFSLWIVVDAHI